MRETFDKGQQIWLNHPVLISYYKGQTKSKWFFQAYVSSKKRTNEFYFTTMKLQVNLFLFVFWRKLKKTKRHFKINWPLVCSIKAKLREFNKFLWPSQKTCRNFTFSVIWISNITIWQSNVQHLLNMNFNLVSNSSGIP